jgi:outer membrane protein OmpA-like peptidoglycan-associated protein
LKRVFLTTGIIFLVIIATVGQSSRFTAHQHLGKEINSPYDEQVPVLSRNGNTLFFTRARHPENIGGIKDKGDIWYSAKTDSGTWAVAKNLGPPFNTTDRNALLGFSPDGNTMYLQNIYVKKGKPRQQGLSVSHKSKSGWSFPEKLDVKYFRNKSEEESVCLSADGNIMILSVESFVSYGVEDLYVSFREGPTSWTEPRNLGPVINTKFQEVTPFLSSDNTLLFFASNGHGGYGSKDIFVSKRLDDTWKNWTSPQNLGPDVNTEGMELSLSLPYGEDFGFLISTQNSDGYGDIHRIDILPADSLQEANKTLLVINSTPEITELKPPVTQTNLKINGKVLNTKTQEPVQALITYEKIPELIKVNVTGSDATTGLYEIILISNQEYMVKVSAKGFMTTEERLVLTATNEASLTINYGITPLEVGTTIALENVFFERGKAVLLDSSYIELNLLVDIMKENSNLKIELSGHTDNQGSAKLNVLLSKDRVAVVRKYMLVRGINKNRITGKGYGGSKPVAPNDREENRRLNRRVEFTVLKN